MGEAKRRKKIDPDYGKIPQQRKARVNTIVQTAMTKNLVDSVEISGSEVTSVHMMVCSHPSFFNRAFCQIRTKEDVITLWSDQPFQKTGSLSTQDREWACVFKIQVINGSTSQVNKKFSMKNASVAKDKSIREIGGPSSLSPLDYFLIEGLLSVGIGKDRSPEKISLQIPSTDIDIEKASDSQTVPSPDYEQLSDLYLSEGLVPLQSFIFEWIREHDSSYISDEDSSEEFNQIATTVLDIASKKSKNLASQDLKKASFELKVPFEPSDYSSYRPVQSNLALARKAMVLINSGFFDNAINELINFEQDSVKTLRKYGLVLYMGTNNDGEVFDTACALAMWKPFQVAQYAGEDRHSLNTIIESTFRDLSTEIQSFRMNVKRADKFPCLTLMCIIENKSTGEVCEFRRHFTAQSGNQLTMPGLSTGNAGVDIVSSPMNTIGSPQHKPGIRGFK